MRGKKRGEKKGKLFRGKKISLCTPRREKGTRPQKGRGPRINPIRYFRGKERVRPSTKHSTRRKNRKKD